MTRKVSRKSYQPMTRHSAELRAKILKMLKSGKSQNEISRELAISLGTVGYHVRLMRLSGTFKG